MLNNIAPKITATPVASSTASASGIHNLLEAGFFREADLVMRSRSATNQAMLPFSRSTLWRMVKDGTFPAPVKLSARITGWRKIDVKNWLESFRH